MAGLFLEVYASGAKAWRLHTRINGQQKKVTIGPFVPDEETPVIGLLELPLKAPHSVRQARIHARKLLALAKAGIDPVAAEQEEAAARARASITFLAVRTAYVDHIRPRLRSWLEVERTLAYDFSPWDKQPIADITTDDARTLVQRKAKKSPYAANRALAYLRTLFSWAIEQGHLKASPADGIRPPGIETKRERILTLTEIARLWEAWDRLEAPWPAVFRLLLITGQRRSEIGGLRWAEIHAVPIDSECTPEYWPISWELRLPAERTKAGRSHVVPLSDLALDIIATLPRFENCPFLFPAFTGKQALQCPIRSFSRSKQASDELCPDMAPWRIHDLRRTAASGLAELGTPLETLVKILNHAPTGVTASVYNRHSYAGEKREALERWGRKLASVVGVVPPAGNVVDLETRRAR